MLHGMLYLASKSPRRRELLARLGPEFTILDLDIPEQRDPAESPHDYVHRVALEKARAGLGLVAHEPDALVLGSDTEVVLGDEVFGKPVDAADAAAMLRRLSGRTHQTVSVVSLVSHARELQAASVTEVTFTDLDDVVIERYLATGEWEGKAGAYAIQGAAEAFVARITGSYSGVMGLPVHETARLLREFGMGPFAA